MRLANSKRGGVNKAFTLIELLAVIVILAIIALIAVPQILRILKQARLSAAVDTTYGIVESAESYVGRLMLANSGDLPVSTYEFECDETGCYLTDEIKKELNGFQFNEKLDFKGITPKSGTIKIENNGTKITAEDLLINEFTCQYTEEEAICEDINGTPAQVSRITTYGVTSTTSSIRININAKDTENGFIKACHYLYDSSDTEITHECIENLNNIKTYNETYTFNTNVDPGTSYKVKTEMYITNSEKLTSEIKTITTTSIGQPVITSSPSGWSQSKIVTINYNGNSNLENYFYTSDIGTSNVGVVNCGNNNDAPSNCDTNEVTNLNAGWYKTSGNVEITYNTEGQKQVKALTKDENGKTSQTASATISYIDVTAPTTPVISVTNTTDSITVTITTVSTDSSTVKYKYSKDNGVNWEPNDYTSSTTHTFSSVADGNYNVIVKAVNETVTTTNNEENSNNTTITSATQVTVSSVPLATSILQVGDLVNMTPTNSSYTVTAAAAGYTQDQPIDTSALTLWRVIKNDGTTVELVSEYVSNEDIHFGDNTSSSASTKASNTIAAYANFVGTLNDIANAYRNTNLTSSARAMGYNSETTTSTITSTTKFSDSQTTAPWKCNTGYSCNPTESQGGGNPDWGVDVRAVRIAYGGIDGTGYSYLIANRCSGTNCSTKTATAYWLACRFYYYSAADSSFSFAGRYLNSSGSISNGYIREFDSVYKTWRYYSLANAIRPIVTLAPGVKVVDDGNDGTTEEKAYNLTN